MAKFNEDRKKVRAKRRAHQFAEAYVKLVQQYGCAVEGKGYEGEKGPGVMDLCEMGDAFRDLHLQQLQQNLADDWGTAN